MRVNLHVMRWLLLSFGIYAVQIYPDTVFSLCVKNAAIVL